MRFFPITATAMTALLSTGALAEDKRGADAHQHGHGALYLALEGETLAIELETPGADILGFEHAAKTARDKSTVDKARKTLSDPAALFGLPDAAGCIVTDVEIEIEIGAHEAEHGDDHDKHANDDHQHDNEHADGEVNHSEVHAHYTLTCSAPSKITGLDLTGFFMAFPNAEELDAAILTDEGQASKEITPNSPTSSF